MLAFISFYNFAWNDHPYFCLNLHGLEISEFGNGMIPEQFLYVAFWLFQSQWDAFWIYER